MEKIYNEVPTKTIQNGSEIISHVYNYASELGWEVIDFDISDASGDFVVIKSEGGSKDNGRLPCYLLIHTNYTAYVNISQLVYWNPEDHTYAGGITYTTPTTPYPYALGMSVDVDNNNMFHFRGNKDFILFTNYRTSNSTTYRSSVFRIDNLFWNTIGHIQDSGSGDNTTVTLLDGEVDQFELGSSYRMVSPDGHIDTATVSSKNSESNQMGIVGHKFPTSSGTYIGTLPFPWVGMGNAYNDSRYHPIALLHDISHHYSTTSNFTNSQSLGNGHGMVYGVNTQKDYFNHGKVSLWPYMFYESGYGVWGHSSYIQYFNYGSDWDSFAVNVQDSGVVVEATSTTLTAMNKNWVDGTLVGLTLLITSGASEEEARYINANTSDVISFEPAISPVISGSETFTVCDGVFLRYPDFCSKSYLGIKVI